MNTYKVACHSCGDSWQLAGTWSAYECGLNAPTLEAFVAFQSRTVELVRSLAEHDSQRVIELDGSAPPAAVLEAALEALHAEMPGRLRPAEARAE